MLKRLHVDNVRCLTNFKLTPEPVSALVGPNGGGKSTIFAVLHSLRGILVFGEDVGTNFPPWSRTRWDKRLVQRVELDVEAAGTPFCYSLTIEHGPDGGAATIQEERLTSKGQLLYEIADGQVHLYGDNPTSDPRTSFPFVGTRSFLPLLEARKDNKRITVFKQWLSGIWLFSLQPFGIDLFSEQESGSLNVSGDNYVSFFRVFVQEHPELVGKIVQDLRPAITGLVNLRLLPLGPNSKALQVECERSGENYPLTIGELSEGQRVLLVLYTILHALPDRASLLLFDEPDNYVAQSEIQPWLSAVRGAMVDSGKGTLLVISHHPEVIDYLSADQALFLWRDEDGPTRVRETEVDLQQGLTLSEWLKLGDGNGAG